MLSNRKQETGRTDSRVASPTPRDEVPLPEKKSHSQRIHPEKACIISFMLQQQSPLGDTQTHFRVKESRKSKAQKWKDEKAARRRRLPWEVEHPGIHSQATTQPLMHKADKRMRDHISAQTWKLSFFQLNVREERSTASYRTAQWLPNMPEFELQKHKSRASQYRYTRVIMISKFDLVDIDGTSHPGFKNCTVGRSQETTHLWCHGPMMFRPQVTAAWNMLSITEHR